MSEKKTYEIQNEGCDDTTYSQMDLTDEEAEVLISFAKENNLHSLYICQPRIHIYCDGKEIV